MTTGKTIALTIQTSVDKVMSLLFNMLSRLVIAFLPRSKHLLISCLQSPSVVLLESKKKKMKKSPYYYLFHIFHCGTGLLRVPWPARKSNRSIIKEINPEYSLEGLRLKLKFQ